MKETMSIKFPLNFCILIEILQLKIHRIQILSIHLRNFFLMDFPTSFSFKNEILQISQSFTMKKIRHNKTSSNFP